MASTSRHSNTRRLPPLPGLGGKKRTSPMSTSSGSSLYTNRDKKTIVHEMVVTGRPNAKKPHPIKTPLDQRSRPSSKSNLSHGTKMNGSIGGGRHLAVDGVISPQDLNPEIVTYYLNENPDFLDKYVLSHVNQDRIEKWSNRRLSTNKQNNKQRLVEPTLLNGDSQESRKPTVAKWKSCLQADKWKLLQDLTKDMNQLSNRSQILHELACCIATAISADGFNLILMEEGTEELYHYKPNTQTKSQSVQSKQIGKGSTLSAYVASSKESVRLNDIIHDSRFPEGLVSGMDKAQSVIAQPILYSSGGILGVVELYRHIGCPYFSPEDEEIVAKFMLWGSVTVHFAEMYHAMTRQRKLNDFLLTVTKSIFQDIVSMDTLIMKIMNFAQKLVNADRASLFLLDNHTNELYARIFDVGIGQRPDKVNREIRFPMDKGVAGHVASTGQILNISDAYKDERFNREVDLQTGYTTKTILCMPIYIRGIIIGVVQMVNKLNGVFNKSDEESFETFAVYCGLALHHAKLYDKIRRSEQKYRVALEVLSYHSQCAEDEFENLKGKPVPDKLPQLIDYNFSPWAVTGDEQPLYVIYMFRDLFEMTRSSENEQRFDLHDLLRFTLTVRKNYRKVPYHNWAHAFSVAHAMYTVIKTSAHHFTPIECLALFVACLCHDLDHRGKNNAFMVKSASPLASIYSTSTMEHHHFNQTVTILQHEGHNIFKHLSSEEYKQVLGEIRHCILATDLALFFGNRAKLKETTEKGEFSWDNDDHRKTLRAITMTGCDLCANMKPWDVQVETVKVIFEEFYEQGDREKELGSKPIPLMDRDFADDLPDTQGDEEKSKGIVPQPMMDRDKKHELPQLEVGFIVGICLPCYELMAEVLPETKAMADGASANLGKWKEMAETQKKEREEKNRAITDKPSENDTEEKADNS